MNNGTTELTFQLMIDHFSREQRSSSVLSKKKTTTQPTETTPMHVLPLSNTAASLSNVPQQTRRSESAQRSLAE
jgi:hypothetical protein